MRLKSQILKIALFATGLSGIVAEYILSTLATYFLGDSVFQWTMIVSVMLFSMGVGSSLSKFIENNLLQKFIFIEFTLSVLVSFSSLLAYSAAAYTIYSGLIIYSLSIFIGILIGMEIPLVIRLNQEFEDLKVNIASVIEKDYYGSLAGGLFFAFVGLPYLGLTYTPFVLGMINFLVALILLFMLWNNQTPKFKRIFSIFIVFIFVFITTGFFVARPVILYGEQQKYKDKVIYTQNSKYQKIVITQWKNHFWLYLNGHQQLSTIDEMLYHEPLVHPAMHLRPQHQDILVLGGGDGCAVRELLKYPDVKTITLVDLDPEMTRIGQEHPIIVSINDSALHNPKVEIINQDGYFFIEKKNKRFYDVIIIDLPDPKTIEIARLYSYEFYKLCKKYLRPRGILITQAGSPYFSTKAFLCIEKTIKKANFTTLKLHNQIVTMGEWGWILGVNDSIDEQKLKYAAQKIRFDSLNTHWINNEAMQLMTAFGKNIYPNTVISSDSIKVNTTHNPVLQRYYLKANWDLY